MRRNVAFCIEDSDISEEKLWAALKLVQLDEFVMTLPDGISTLIGEHGARLSGGQRQRLAMARALYNDPEVLVFDEATSALDSVTEHEVSTAIDGLAGIKTVLIVAHRLSTVQKCDTVVLLEHGRVEATGTFTELADKSEIFRRYVHLGLSDKSGLSG